MYEYKSKNNQQQSNVKQNKNATYNFSNSLKNIRALVQMTKSNSCMLSHNDALVLQRALGNWNFGKLLASGGDRDSNSQQSAADTMPVQRMSIQQAQLNDGLENIGDRTLVTDGREVHVYFKEEAAECNNKVEALEKAGELNAAIGKKVDNYAQGTLRIADSNSKWTPGYKKLDTDTEKTLDPFFHSVKIPYKNKGKSEKIELVFQHAKNWTGYVEAVYDSANKGTSAVPTMYDSDSESASTGKDGSNNQNGHYRNLKYSNRHDDKSGRLLLDLTEGDDEQSFDAYTKIAGEGARWICVRKHTGKLWDGTRFFTKSGVNPRNVDFVYFADLWKTWKDTFGKAYDIPDATVKSRISAGSITCRVHWDWRSKMTEFDYDLDNHRSHKKK
jgi:hypothetical protein